MAVQALGIQTRRSRYVSESIYDLIRLMEQDNVGPINIGNLG